jgi:hypothetical protein
MVGKNDISSVDECAHNRLGEKYCRLKSQQDNYFIFSQYASQQFVESHEISQDLIRYLPRSGYGKRPH